MSAKDLEMIKRIENYKSEQERLKMRQNAFNVDLDYNKYPNASTYSLGVEKRFNEGNTFAFGQVSGVTGHCPSFVSAGFRHKF